MPDIFINAHPRVPAEWMGDLVVELKRKNHKKFVDDRETLQDAYEGDNLEELTNKWFKSKDAKGNMVVQKNVPPARQNLLNRAIRRISLVYKNQPDYGDGKFPEGYDPAKRWLFFKGAERTSNNIGTVLLRPVTRDDKLDYDIITNWIPFFGDDPLTPIGILYPLFTPSASTLETTKIEWMFWTAEVSVKLDSDGKVLSQPDNTENINPYGILPFITANVREGADYFRAGYGGPLLDANTAINVALTEMRIGIRFNMMGQWVAKGVDDKTVIKLGGDQVVRLGDVESDLNAIAPPANMEAAITYLKAEYENTMQNVGLQVTWGEDGGVPSGESLKVKNLELLERREDDVANWLMIDNAVYEVEQKIWEVDMKGTLPERSINFNEIEFPKTTTEQQAEDDWDLEHGQTTEAAILWRDDPDGYKTIEEAQKKVDENKTANTPSTRPVFERTPNAT